MEQLNNRLQDRGPSDRPAHKARLSTPMLLEQRQSSGENNHLALGRCLRCSLDFCTGVALGRGKLRGPSQPVADGNNESVTISKVRLLVPNCTDAERVVTVPLGDRAMSFCS